MFIIELKRTHSWVCFFFLTPPALCMLFRILHQSAASCGFNSEPHDFQKCWRAKPLFLKHSCPSFAPMPLSLAQSLFQLLSAYCSRPVLKCSSFIFVFICQFSETQVPLRAAPQNLKLESQPNPGRSIDNGCQA